MDRHTREQIDQSRGGIWIMTKKEKIYFWGYVSFWVLVIIFALLGGCGII